MEHNNDSGSAANGRAAAAHDSIDRIASSARPAVDRFVNTAHQAVDKLAGVASQARERFGTRSESLKSQQEQLISEARTYIRNKPGTAVGIAVAAGFILSRLLRR